MRHVAERSGSQNGPLTEPVFLILTSLLARPRHGYALLQDIEQISGGRVRLSTGTLYGALGRLVSARWIERFSQEDTSRDKQAYRLTGDGRQQLQSEVERMRALARLASGRMKESEL